MAGDVAGIELDGGSTDDVLSGSGGDDLIDGGDGNDQESGGDGADELEGGDGDDTLSGGDGGDLLIGGDGADTLSGGPGPDTFIGGDDDDCDCYCDVTLDDLIINFQPNDTIRTELTVNDVTQETIGDVTVLSFFENGQLVGGVFLIGPVDGTFTPVVNTDGTTTLRFTPRDTGGTGTAEPVSVNTATQTSGGRTITVTTMSGGDHAARVALLVPQGDGAAVVSLLPGVTDQGTFTMSVPAEYRVVASGAERPQSGATARAALLEQALSVAGGVAAAASMSEAVNRFADSLGGGAVAVRAITMTGTPSSGAPLAFSGADGGRALVIDARAAGAAPFLRIDGVGFAAVAGAATVSGGDGASLWSGDGAAQTMLMGAAADTGFGGGGGDALYGNADADLLYGNQGGDTLFGGKDADTLFGGQDGDALYGNLGNDVLSGQLGDDTLYGGDGDDIVAGGDGADTLYGGQGADLFRLDPPGAGADVIADFESGVDRIAISGPNFGNLPAGTLAAGRFALDNPATADATFVFDTRTGVLSYDADGTGAGAAVAVATLGVRTLSAADILVLPG